MFILIWFVILIIDVLFELFVDLIVFGVREGLWINVCGMYLVIYVKVLYVGGVFKFLLVGCEWLLKLLVDFLGSVCIVFCINIYFELNFFWY